MRFLLIFVSCLFISFALIGRFVTRTQKSQIADSPKPEMSNARALMGILSMFIALLLSGFIAEFFTKAEVNTINSPPPQIHMVEEVKIRGRSIRKDKTTADKLFESATHSEEVGRAQTSPDFLLPDSVTVRHEYRIEGKNYTFYLTRKLSNGPYYVTGIAIQDYAK